MVILEWEEVKGIREDEYYVVLIPYNEAGEVAEFWRKEPRMRVPSHFSTVPVGFPDRHYNWTVPDNVKKRGIQVGSVSAPGLFYWHVDVGIPPTSTPTKKPP
jgi:hypothetical protein